MTEAETVSLDQRRQTVFAFRVAFDVVDQHADLAQPALLRARRLRLGKPPAAAPPSVVKNGRRAIAVVTRSLGVPDFLARANLACFDGRVWGLDMGVFRCGLRDLC